MQVCLLLKHWNGPGDEARVTYFHAMSYHIMLQVAIAINPPVMPQCQCTDDR